MKSVNFVFRFQTDRKWLDKTSGEKSVLVVLVFAKVALGKLSRS